MVKKNLRPTKRNNTDTVIIVRDRVVVVVGWHSKNLLVWQGGGLYLIPYGQQGEVDFFSDKITSTLSYSAEVDFTNSVAGVGGQEVD